jgi:multiple antibiotic resistance protein
VFLKSTHTSPESRFAARRKAVIVETVPSERESRPWWHFGLTSNDTDTHSERDAVALRTADIALFPLTIPFTTGPGTISVAVALGAGHPSGFAPLGWFFLGMTAAAVAMTVVIWVTYTYADRLTQLMGPTGTRTITRMSAFLLLCIGVQILISGVQDVLGPMLAAR